MVGSRGRPSAASKAAAAAAAAPSPVVVAAPTSAKKGGRKTATQTLTKGGLLPASVAQKAGTKKTAAPVVAAAAPPAAAPAEETATKIKSTPRKKIVVNADRLARKITAGEKYGDLSRSLKVVTAELRGEAPDTVAEDFNLTAPGAAHALVEQGMMEWEKDLVATLADSLEMAKQPRITIKPRLIRAMLMGDGCPARLAAIEAARAAEEAYNKAFNDFPKAPKEHKMPEWKPYPKPSPEEALALKLKKAEEKLAKEERLQASREAAKLKRQATMAQRKLELGQVAA